MAKTKWTIDPTHSEIGFKVKHMMISTVTGKFDGFEASLEMQGDDLSTAKVQFSAAVDSINTGNTQRDHHLQAADFFDAEKYGKVTFQGQGLKSDSDGHYQLSGLLSMRGVSRPVILHVEYGGRLQDPWGNTRIGFELIGKINRQDFGVSFSKLTDTGGLMLGDEVKLFANVEFVKEAELQPA
jgi:polyisoprenoid-binding protein YceI